MFDAQTMLDRKVVVGEKIDEIRDISTPLRLARDAHVQACRRVEDAMNAEIKMHEQGLFDLEQEYAIIARGLGTLVMSQGTPEERVEGEPQSLTSKFVDWITGK